MARGEIVFAKLSSPWGTGMGYKFAPPEIPQITREEGFDFIRIREVIGRKPLIQDDGGSWRGGEWVYGPWTTTPVPRSEQERLQQRVRTEQPSWAIRPWAMLSGMAHKEATDLIFPCSWCIGQSPAIGRYVVKTTVLPANLDEIIEVHAAWQRGEPVADQLVAMSAHLPNQPGIFCPETATRYVDQRSAAPFGWPTASIHWERKTSTIRRWYHGMVSADVTRLELKTPDGQWVVAGTHSAHEAWADCPAAAEWQATLPPVTDPRPRINPEDGDRSEGAAWA